MISLRVLQIRIPQSSRTHIFLGDWEVKQVHETEVVSGDKRKAAGRQVRTVHVSLVSVPRPHANHFVTKDTERKEDEAKSAN